MFVKGKCKVFVLWLAGKMPPWYNMLIMKHVFEKKVYYADTDAYGVVWHGSYLRWLEAGRVEYCEQLSGKSLAELEANDIVLPVTNMNVRYKLSAKLNDIVVIETEITKYNGLSITFYQTVKSKETGKTYIEATFDVVAISSTTGKLYRRVPAIIAESIEKELKCLQPV